MKDKIHIGIITALLLWAGTQLVQVNSLTRTVDENRDSIQSLIGLHLKE